MPHLRTASSGIIKGGGERDTHTDMKTCTLAVFAHSLIRNNSDRERERHTDRHRDTYICHICSQNHQETKTQTQRETERDTHRHKDIRGGYS